MKQILLLSTILIFAASCVSNSETSSLASNEQDEKDGRICKQEEVLGSEAWSGRGATPLPDHTSQTFARCGQTNHHFQALPPG